MTCHSSTSHSGRSANDPPQLTLIASYLLAFFIVLLDVFVWRP